MGAGVGGDGGVRETAEDFVRSKLRRGGIKFEEF